MRTINSFSCSTPQGIKFLDAVWSIIEHPVPPYRPMNDMQLDQINDEIYHWLKLLIQLVKIIEPNSPSHLRLFLSDEHSVTRKYRDVLVKVVSLKSCYVHQCKFGMSPHTKQSSSMSTLSTTTLTTALSCGLALQ